MIPKTLSLNFLLGANAARIVLAMAALTNVFILFIAADAVRGYQMGSQVVLPVVRAMAFICMLVLLPVHLYRSWVAPDAFTVVVLAYAVVGTVLGLAFGNDFLVLIRHLFASLMIAGFYWLGMVMRQPLSLLSKDLNAWSWTTFAASIGLYVFLFSDLGTAVVSTSPNSLLLTLAVGLSWGPIWAAAVVVLLIAIGNNRAAVLGASVALAMWIAARITAFRTVGRMALAITLVPALFIGTSLLVIGLNKAAVQLSRTHPLILSERLNRLFDLPLTSETDTGAVTTYRQMLNDYSSNRVVEFESVLESIDKSWGRLFLGAGFGATFEFEYYSNNLNLWQTYVRFQPDVAASYFLLTGGVIFSIAILLMFLHRLFLLFRGSLSGVLGGPTVLFVLSYSVGNLVGFVPNNPLLWLLMGSLWKQLECRKLA